MVKKKRVANDMDNYETSGGTVQEDNVAYNKGNESKMLFFLLEYIILFFLKITGQIL